MTQKTAKTVVEALTWINTEPHHYASVMDEDGFFILKGYGTKLRIPNAIHAQMQGMVQPGDRLDARMYVPTAKGRKVLRAAVQP